MPPSESTYQFTPDFASAGCSTACGRSPAATAAIDPTAAVTEMIAYHDAGFTTWDLADHYGPAEDFIGEFRRRLAARSGPQALAAMQAFTKWVPSPGPMTRQVVERAVDVSRRRMDTETLDLCSSTGGSIAIGATWMRWSSWRRCALPASSATWA